MSTERPKSLAEHLAPMFRDLLRVQWSTDDLVEILAQITSAVCAESVEPFRRIASAMNDNAAAEEGDDDHAAQLLRDYAADIEAACDKLA